LTLLGALARHAKSLIRVERILVNDQLIPVSLHLLLQQMALEYMLGRFDRINRKRSCRFDRFCRR